MCCECYQGFILDENETLNCFGELERSHNHSECENLNGILLLQRIKSISHNQWYCANICKIIISFFEDLDIL